ncbi:ETS factor [Chionoecetes opilio]|uniref:ETS factor n=1 Tax=Chionoecetes opilio TaxID=41210 RepID=A0A8J5BZ07_CHIOP|nr:ETS factor [Chionoecetes opilio]
MLSEPPRKRPHPDVFSNIVPTASKKRLHLDPTDRGGNEYKNKPISQWKYMDVVNFFMDGWISNLDCNFSDISGVEGPELARLPREKFRQLSSKHGDKLFKEVQRRVMLERENELKKKKKRTGRLWEFIRNLLFNPETCPSMVKWENAEEGLFRFIDGEKVAKRWGDRKQNKDMNYEKLSRAMSGVTTGQSNLHYRGICGRELPA